MMRLMLILAVAVSTTAMAQPPTSVQPTMNTDNYSTYARSVESLAPFGSRETPTMRREKREKALALREEASRLQREDGGNISEEHAAYIRKKANEILYGNKGRRTGSLVLNQ